MKKVKKQEGIRRPPTEPVWRACEKSYEENNPMRGNLFFNKRDIYKEKENRKETSATTTKNSHYFSSVRKGNVTSTRIVATMKDLCPSDKEKLAKLITKLALEETKNQKLEQKNKNYKSLLKEERIKNEQLQNKHNGLYLQYIYIKKIKNFFKIYELYIDVYFFLLFMNIKN